MKSKLLALFLLVAIAGEGQSRHPNIGHDSPPSPLGNLWDYIERIDTALDKMQCRLNALEHYYDSMIRVYSTPDTWIKPNGPDTPWLRYWPTPNDSVANFGWVARIDGPIPVDTAYTPSRSGFDGWVTNNFIFRAGKTGPYWNRRHDASGDRYTAVQLWRMWKRRWRL